eukprot:XP_001700845.1 predicted protein [Chlamydomonas reinhardtii]
MLGLTRPELRLALLAVAVRLALLLGATGGDLLLPDYDTSKTLPAELLQPVQPAAFHQSHSADGLQEPWMGDGQPQAGAAAAGATQSARPWLLRGWLVWDAVFFVDIAARGYVYEQYYAFFPLMPALLSRAPPELFALLAVALNAAASVAGVVMLYRLGASLICDPELSAAACLFFILSPAAVFHAAPYTEAAFAAATLAVLCCLHCRGIGGGSSSSRSRSRDGIGGLEGAVSAARGSRDQRRGGLKSGGPGFSLARLMAATAAVAVSCGLRSNGVVNAGYVGHYSLRHAVALWPKSKARALWTALLGVVAAAVSVTPLVLFQAAAYEAFCRRDAHGAAHVSSAAPAGAYDAGVGSSSSSSTGSTGGGGGGSTGPYDWPRPWCSSRVPYVYGFVQLLYWNVGFLRYWTLQQAPNFLLAMPVLLLSAAGLFEYSRANAGHMACLGLMPPGRTHSDGVAAAAEDTAAEALGKSNWRSGLSKSEGEAQLASVRGAMGEHSTGQLRRRLGLGGASDAGAKVAAAGLLQRRFQCLTGCAHTRGTIQSSTHPKCPDTVSICHGLLSGRLGRALG